jgi:taurine dioxygenase
VGNDLVTEPLSVHLGVRVRAPQPVDIDPAELGRLVHEHLLVVFDTSDLGDDHQHELVGALGDAYIHPLARLAGATEPQVSRIVDDADHPPYQDKWHTDVTFDHRPPTIGSLRCIDMPPLGGDTLWANMYSAYEALSDSDKELLDGLTAVHSTGGGEAFASKAGADLARRMAEEFDATERAAVGVHPVTGRRYLDVNSGFTRAIAALDVQDSDALLQRLFAHAASPNWQYRHRWTEGELAVWDERATQHYAVADHFPNRREMARFVVC